jgi:hypothetical protein
MDDLKLIGKTEEEIIIRDSIPDDYLMRDRNMLD